MSISSGESVTQTIGEEFPLETRPFKRKGLKGQSLELDKDGILEYIHALEILASSPLSKGSRDFNRGEQSPAPPPPLLLHLRNRHQPPRPPPSPLLDLLVLVCMFA